MNETPLEIIGYIHTDFSSKFGIPRQSGLAKAQGVIIFEEEFRNPHCLMGIEEYSHLWLIWQFSENKDKSWSPTVRPPRLGGNTRRGVFATRSPFRPNGLGLSSVKLEKVELGSPQGPLVYVSGVDLMDGTPIYDIKPYLPYVDSHPEAVGGFTDQTKDYHLQVDFPPELLEKIPAEKQSVLKEVLSEDPRPSYQEDAARIYGMEFAGFEIKFSVSQNRLLVKEVIEESSYK